VTAGPPWVLACPVVAITRPQPPDIEVAVRPTPAVVTVAWPRVRVTGDRLVHRGERVIRLPAPPQGPWRLPLPQGHPLRRIWSPPPRAPRPPA
jgi:hypothetical protein